MRILPLLLILPAWSQDDKNHVCPANPPPQSEIDKAVARGVDFLRESSRKIDLNIDPHGGHTLEELILAAMVYGGQSEEDPDVQKLLKAVLDRSCRRTYETVLLAVTLDKLDNEVYLWKLVECGQFLLDNQCENGQWSYGETVEIPVKTKKLIQELRAWGEQRRHLRKKGKPVTRAEFRIELTAGPHRRPSGDNSNTQFAALGLRICSDAGIRFPRKRVELARAWWLEHQEKDGGWTYTDREKEESYLSMTAGGTGALVALQTVLEADLPPKSRDARAEAVAKAVERGLAWLGANFTFDPPRAVFMKAPYSHYSIERAGILGQVEKIGPHPWYAEGAADLIRRQRKDGAWRLSRARGKEPEEAEKWAMIDTAIAILFFKRSVRPPVATGESKEPGKR
ncbi:MAG: terpene cyclase/mutase family protein [Planctomycetes bacterium]|nr:terpene cyclase/mutase family protein [Planctomycetota bacterium]